MVLADVLTLDGIVKILGAGLSGFGFLLMYLVFQLLKQIITVKAVHEQAFKTIRTYMILCFGMTIAVGIFTIVSAVYKTDQLAQKTNTIDTIRLAVTALTATQKSKSATDSIIKFPESKGAAAAKTEQKKALDTIGNFVAKTSPQTRVDSFKKLKTIVLSYPDSIKKLNQEDPGNKVKAAYFQQKYVKANEGINIMTHSIVAKAVRVNK